MIILGIDPGTAKMGYGVVSKAQNSKSKNKFRCLGYGLIKTSPSLSAGDRLKKINLELSRLIKKYQPEVMAVERLFFFKNLKTVMPVSQACGVILLTAAQKKIPAHQFTPLQVKMTIAGHGWAEKKQVQKKIKKLLNLKEDFKSGEDDAADALAVAATCFLIGKI